MNIQTRKWSTPLVIGCSLFVAVTGIMMFFHLGTGLLKTAHEWIGIAFVVGMLLHVLNHWEPFKRYFSQKMAVSIMSLVLAVSAAFIVTGDNSPSPIRSMVQQVENSRVVDLAQLQQRSVEDIALKLKSAGIELNDSQMTVTEVAESNNVAPFKLVAILFNNSPQAAM